MKTQSATIYHCVSCGRVVQPELEAERPQCCGHAMAIAVPETTTEGVIAGGTATGNTGEPPPAIPDRQKPR